ADLPAHQQLDADRHRHLASARPHRALRRVGLEPGRQHHRRDLGRPHDVDHGRDALGHAVSDVAAVVDGALRAAAPVRSQLAVERVGQRRGRDLLAVLGLRARYSRTPTTPRMSKSTAVNLWPLLPKSWKAIGKPFESPTTRCFTTLNCTPKPGSSVKPVELKS